jgi:hypothetical protein
MVVVQQIHSDGSGCLTPGFDVEDDVEIGDQVILLGRLFFLFYQGRENVNQEL